MNLHNLTQKNFFEGYMAPPPVISRCYSVKANVNTFTPSCQPVNSLFSVNKYLSSMGNFNKKNQGLCEYSSLRMQPLVRKGNDSVCDPIVKIVGGFVGSKSQAGSATHRGREWSLWDFIMDKIIEAVEHPGSRQSQSVAKKCNDSRKAQQKFEGYTMIGVERFGVERFGSGTNSGRCESCSHGKWIHCARNDSSAEIESGFSNLLSSSRTIGKMPCEDSSSISERLGDLPPKKVCLSQVEISATEPAAVSLQCSNARPTHNRDNVISESDDDTSDVLSSSWDSRHSAGPFLPRKAVQRSISECSVDSDDSFIVFESTEDGPALLSEESDDDGSCSDDDLDEIDNCILYPHNIDHSPPHPMLTRLQEANEKWNLSYSDAGKKSDGTCSARKVRFGEGLDLFKIKRLVAWDFAHRAARVGPWEMYYRDSVRFKARIAALSTVLSPVLAATHRKTIYSERFQT